MPALSAPEPPASMPPEPEQPPKPVDCLITAAGLSSRMGQWKMMLPFGQSSCARLGSTILDNSISNALSFCQRVILVTGHRGNELQSRYQEHPRVHLVQNPFYEQGLFSSIQSGIRHCDTDYLFITHGDMPMIPRSVFAQLWQERREDILFPTVTTPDQMTGHPVLIHRSQFQDILLAPSDARMKKILLSQPYRCIPVGSETIHQDIDTPERYQLFT